MVPEPLGFDERVRKPGNAWLAENPGAERPRDLWSPFRAVLAEGFANRCGYTALHEPVGTVDHFASTRERPALAYEWSNYRFASQWINSSKKAGGMLDPHVVGEALVRRSCCRRSSSDDRRGPPSTASSQSEP